MTIEDLEHFRNLLLEREANVAAWLNVPGAASTTDLQKTYVLLGQIRDALGRINQQHYGYCKACGDGIEPHRLEIQPVTQVCLGCISAEEQAQLEEDLFLASKIHRALLPQSIAYIPDCTLDVRSAAARFVGGDYYDILPGPDGSALVVIADCMGKGVSAGLLMSNVQGALRILADDSPAPSDLIKRLNRWLCRNVPVTKFVSLVCLSVHPRPDGTARLVCVNAGHCPPLVIRRDGSTSVLGPTGAVLGVQEDFDYGEEVLTMSSGDILVLYTDGLLEAENDSGEMFGEQRLCDLITKYHHAEPSILIDAVVAGVQAFSQRTDWADDYTLMALRKK